jgi:signal transduction histidine kinase
MLHEFLEANRMELIERCRVKVARRPNPGTKANEMVHGIPLFLAQLIEMLRMESLGPASDHCDLAAPSRSKDARRHVPSDLATSAARYGHELLRDGYAVDQVVYHYGDLCQAITELAIDKDVTVSAEDFHTLNRCLDDAIADAVTEFGFQRDQLIAEISTRAMSERLGFLAHELRNSLNTAILSFAAIKMGGVAVNGSTSAVLDRSLLGLRDLIDRALADVRLDVGLPAPLEPVALDRFIAEVKVAASLEANASGCEFTVSPVEPGLAVRVDRPMLYSAVSNLLQNAFKFTRSHSHVALRVSSAGDLVRIEVEDQCGGLPAGKAEAMFRPFEQHGVDRSGLGLGLSISRRAVEASGGKLYVRDMPGVGCVFTIDLPRSDDRSHAAVSHAARSPRVPVTAG